MKKILFTITAILLTMSACSTEDGDGKESATDDADKG